VELRRVRQGLAEAALIIVSVLFAFWIDAWWDGRQADAVESLLVTNVVSEAERNRHELERVISRNRQSSSEILRFLESTPNELREIDPDSVALVIRGFVRWETYNPEVGAAQMLTSLPPPDIEGVVVRDLTSVVLRALDDANEDLARSTELRDAIFRALASHAAPHVGQGFGPYEGMIARGGPEALAVLRGDPSVVGAVMHKAAIQFSYTDELSDVRALLDSLESQLAR
jgi:hypothetical protein